MDKRIQNWLFLFLILGLTGCSANNNTNTMFIRPSAISFPGVDDITPFHLRLFLFDKARFDNPQGVAIIPSNSLDKPFPQYVVWVNSGSNQVVFNSPEYQFKGGLRTPFSASLFGADSEQKDVLNRPSGIAADALGNVYVTDRGNSRIVKFHFSQYTPFLKLVGSFGSAGTEPGQFLDPRGIAVMRNSIAVVDAGLGRCTILDKKGDVQSYWEGLDEPVAIAWIPHLPIISNVIDFDTGYLLVIDSLARRLTNFDLQGNILARVSAMDWGAPFTPELTAIAVDRHRQILITDFKNGCIHKLDHSLKYLASFGANPNDPYHFDEPRGIAVDPVTGDVFVVERSKISRHISAVDVPEFDASVHSDSLWKSLELEFFTTEPSHADIDIYDSRGRFITRLVQDRTFDAGENHFEWGLVVSEQLPGRQSVPSAGSLESGNRLPEGIYTVKGRFRPSLRSSRSFTREAESEFVLKW